MLLVHNVFFILIVLVGCLIFVNSMRSCERVEIPTMSPGNRRFLVFYSWGKEESDPRVGNSRVYIQAALHADEIPGLLVANHLIKLIDEADKRGEVTKQIIIAPYANPIGLSQNILDSHIGRFSLETSVNFNRNWIDFTKKVCNRISTLLTDDASSNVNNIRKILDEEISSINLLREDDLMKQIILKKAATADIVLDLHCDSDAILHIYTHDELWPQLSDLAAELGSECQLIAPHSGGHPFDEICSGLWANLAAQYPAFPIPIACESATIELRGESQVSDSLAAQDAYSLFRFLQRRGYIAINSTVGYAADPACSSSISSDNSSPGKIGSSDSTTPLLPPSNNNNNSNNNVVDNNSGTISDDFNEIGLPPLPPLKREATFLDAVDMVEATVPGVVAWRVSPGSTVHEGEVLGEIVNIEDIDIPRNAIISRTNGIVFSMKRHKLVRPGQVIIKVAGTKPLPWRSGNLLPN